MKKTFLYLALAAAALTFVACEKKEEKTTEVKTEEMKPAETKHAEHKSDNTETKTVETAPEAEKVEVKQAEQANPQPSEAKDNMPQMQTEQPANNEKK